MDSQNKFEEFWLINFLFETKFSILIKDLMEYLVRLVILFNRLMIINIIVLFNLLWLLAFLNKLLRVNPAGHLDRFLDFALIN